MAKRLNITATKTLKGAEELYQEAEKLAGLSPQSKKDDLKETAFRKALILNALRNRNVRESNSGVMLRRDIEDARLMMTVPSRGNRSYPLCDFGTCASLGSTHIEYGVSCGDPAHVTMNALQLLAVGIQELLGLDSLDEFSGEHNWTRLLERLTTLTLFRKRFFGRWFSMRVEDGAIVYTISPGTWARVCIRPWCLRTPFKTTPLCRSCTHSKRGFSCQDGRKTAAKRAQHVVAYRNKFQLPVNPNRLLSTTKLKPPRF